MVSIFLFYLYTFLTSDVKCPNFFILVQIFTKMFVMLLRKIGGGGGGGIGYLIPCIEENIS